MPEAFPFAFAMSCELQRGSSRPVRHEGGALRTDLDDLERNDDRTVESPKRIGLRVPIEIAERCGKSKRMVLRAFVVGEGGL